ncbi:MAG: CHASE2 domain-containing protein [Candidatus Omnitrophota bacterium]
MKFNKNHLFNLLIALAVTCAVLFLFEKGAFKRLELTGLDVLFRLRGPIACSPKVIIIEIDDDNITQVGRWPWKRRIHAAMVEALTAFGAKQIFFDVIFSEPSSEEDDGLLGSSIEKSGNVYLPFVFQGESTRPEDAFFPIEQFSSYIKGTGSINIHPDSDGTLRRVPLVFPSEDAVYPHMALKLAADYLGAGIDKITPGRITISHNAETIEIPLIEENKMLINWAGEWKDTFKHYSYLGILGAYRAWLGGDEVHIDLDDFKDSICLVGVTAIGLYDINPVPLEPAYPGIGAVATTVSNVLNGNFIRTFPRWLSWLLIFILGIIPSLSISGEKTLRGTVVVVLLGGAFFAGALFLFKKGIWIEFAAPVISLAGSYLSVVTYNFIHASMEKRHFFQMAVTDGLTGLCNIRYFKMLLKTELLMAEKEPSKSFCIVMSDVDHFKSFNDTYGHQIGDLVLKEVAKVLKGAVRSSDTVARYGGEEMIILFRGASLKYGLEAAEKVRDSMEKHTVVDENGKEYKVCISVGVSLFRHGDDEDSMIKRADDGLYKAKEGGRNRVETVEEIANA